MNYNTLKFQTNIPELVTFQYDDFKTGTGEYGEWFKYVIENRGETKVMFPTKILHEIIQRLSPLQGKTIEICKYEDGQRKLWKLSENGQPINAQNAPAPSAPTQTTPAPMQTPQNAEFVSKEQYDRMVLATTNNFATISKTIKEMKAEIKALKLLNVKLEDKADPSAFEIHNDINQVEEIPII